MTIKFKENKNGTWNISLPCQNGLNLQVLSHGKVQSYEIRIGEYPGSPSHYFDNFANATVTEHCYFDDSVRAIVRDIKDWITVLFSSLVEAAK